VSAARHVEGGEWNPFILEIESYSTYQHRVQWRKKNYMCIKYNVLQLNKDPEGFQEVI
jgi:hypothetical protein